LTPFDKRFWKKNIHFFQQVSFKSFSLSFALCQWKDDFYLLMIIQGQDYIWQRILVKPNCFKSKYYIEEKMQGANNRYILNKFTADNWSCLFTFIWQLKAPSIRRIISCFINISSLVNQTRVFSFHQRFSHITNNGSDNKKRIKWRCT
jgi:hypothetical protein